MTPITPGSRPSPAAAPSSPASYPAGSQPPTGRPPAGRPPSSLPAASLPPSSLPAASLSSSSLPGGSFPPASVSPADSGQPFRATLTNAAISNARAERQRTVIPPRPGRAPSSPAPGSATDYSSLPMPTQRPEPAEPGSRANWPLINPSGDEAASISAPPADTGRVKPPWQDMPKEPPALRLVDSQLAGGSMETTVAGLPPISEPPSLRVVDGERGRAGMVRRSVTPSTTSTTSTKLTALDRSTTPPVAADSNDTDLLIFAAARSAWFTGHSDTSADLDWANPNDSGWRAAERAATPEIAAETAAGLPKRVPQANLVPGSPLRDERPLRIVRDAASIAAHTTGYFRGWRRGQEIGGFAMGGRPGRESAGGWDFTRDREGADEYRNNNANYGSR
jgi:hypothetical protein